MRAFTIQGSSPPATIILDTSACFDLSHRSHVIAAIDQFFDNHQQINRLATPEMVANHPVLGGLALLGSISAVEGYLREVIRRTILIDRHSEYESHSRTLTYGAACIHKRDMLPEALLEDISFTSSENIKNAFAKLLGLTRPMSNDLKGALKAYENICQFRHCVVHRFGKLGTRNAIHLGLDAHVHCVEKPLMLTYSHVQDTFAINYGAVKSLNDFIFTEVLRRTGEKRDWSWSYRRDRRRFQRFWDLFISRVDPPATPSSAREAYDLLAASYP